MELAIQNKFDSYPKDAKAVLLQVRSLILEIAQQQDLGAVEETLKWGEPSYLTTNSKSGTTIRIDWKPKYPDRYSLYVSCKTTLVDTYRSIFPELVYEGNRAIVFDIKNEIPENELRLCIDMALKYHLNKTQG